MIDKNTGTAATPEQQGGPSVEGAATRGAAPVDPAEEPAFLDDDEPSDDIPAFITTKNAKDLFDVKPGETVAEAAARKASGG